MNEEAFSLQLHRQHFAFATEYSLDFNAPRAAEAVGLSPGVGHELLSHSVVQQALGEILDQRLHDVNIDAEWLLKEAVKNHRLARQAGNLNASNRALELIGKLSQVDAFAAQKIDVVNHTEVTERLRRGRSRARLRVIEGEYTETISSETKNLGSPSRDNGPPIAISRVDPVPPLEDEGFTFI